MAPAKNKFIVREPELAAALKITVQKLDEIVAFFDSDPNDEWDLVEGTDYICIHQGTKERIYSIEGSYAVARYMAALSDKNIFLRFLEAITHIKKRIRNAFIQRIVLDNSSSLTFKNNRHYLSKKDVVAIFSTSHARINKAFKDLKVSEIPLVIEKDFDDFEQVRYYSLSGIDRIGRVLGSELTRKDRREWCESVHVVASDTIKLLESEEVKQQKRIDEAKKKAKSRDKNTCQITGEHCKTKHQTFNLAAHHLYSSSKWPTLADSTDNLISIKESIHKDFHQWQGGSGKPCTPDDLIEYVILFHSEHSMALVTLKRFKSRLQSLI